MASQVTDAAQDAAIAATDQSSLTRASRQAILLWIVFIVCVVVLNGTIPFAFGADLRAWTTSPVKSVIFAFVFYALFFLAVPLVLVKGWTVVRQPGFIIPLCLAMLALTMWHVIRGVAVVSIIALAYLHWRYDLSDYGIRSRGWKGDLFAVLLMGLLGLFPLLMRPPTLAFSFVPALLTALDRLFANPASTVENLFYFGFLTERLSYQTGKWFTPLLIGLMYTAHEMSNPEYWYGGMSFVLIFAGVAIWSAVYLWRRGAVAIWLGDGLYRFVGALF
jgi:hypothetical protein